MKKSVVVVPASVVSVVIMVVVTLMMLDYSKPSWFGVVSVSSGIGIGAFVFFSAFSFFGAWGFRRYSPSLQILGAALTCIFGIGFVGSCIVEVVARENLLNNVFLAIEWISVLAMLAIKAIAMKKLLAK